MEQLGQALYTRVAALLQESMEISSTTLQVVDRRALASRLLLAVDGDKKLLPACWAVEEVLYMDRIVTSNERARLTAELEAAAAATTSAPASS